MFRIGLKYCGGCNPAFDRVAAVERIKGELEGIAVIVPLDHDSTEMVLAVMGCGAACADLEGINEDHLIVITSEKEIDAAIEEIKRKQKVLK